MTITITLQELIEHENAMQKWLSARADFQWDILTHGEAGARSLRADVVSWEKENPRPTLIPYQREIVEYRLRFEPGGMFEMQFKRP